MKRVGALLPDVASFENLLAAFHRARRGKAGRPAIERFHRRLEPELLALQRELLEGSYTPRPGVRFRIRDPKPRMITVAPFRDRVVHQALYAVIGPHLERGMDPDAYGSRTGRGLDQAIRRARKLARRWPWALKTDIASYFASIRHDLVLVQLQRLFKDRALLEILRRGIALGGQDGRGLDLGSLTSQCLAHRFLTPLDRYLRQSVAVRGLVRYCDDILLFGTSRAALRGVLADTRSFLAERLDLSLQPRATGLYATRWGFPFLGFRVCAGRLELRRETWKRFRTAIGALHHRWRRGELSDAERARRAQSLIAHVRRADSHGLRAVWLRRIDTQEGDTAG